MPLPLILAAIAKKAVVGAVAKKAGSMLQRKKKKKVVKKKTTTKKPPLKKTGGKYNDVGGTTKNAPTDAKKFAAYKAAGGKMTSTSAAQIGYRTPEQSRQIMKEARARNKSGIPTAKSPTTRKKTVAKKKKK
jgi:hypothetical protein